MNNILIVVDMQKDFVDGALGTKEAAAIIPKVCDKIKNFDGEIIVTLDTHTENYLNTAEGKALPIAHCIKGTAGHNLDSSVQEALDGKQYTVVEKTTFGSEKLSEIVKAKAGGEEFSLELLGLCTDNCVVSNALLLKAYFPEGPITVDSSLCAGVTRNSHNAALLTMKMCQINIL